MRAQPTALVLGALAAALVFGPLARGAIFATAQDVVDAAENARTNACYDPVGLVAVQIGSSWWVVGSGVVIGRQSVLLAAHQLRFLSNYTSVRITFRSGTNNVARTTADWWGIHPGCPVGTPVGSGVDLAMLHLSTAVTNIAPATLFTNELPSNVLMYMAGFGVPGVAGYGYSAYDIIKRAGCNIVGDTTSIWIESQYVMCSFDPPGKFDSQPGEWQLSDYDSGGGWFINADGQMKLAAIGSFAGPNGNWDFYSKSGAIALRPYLDWIMATSAAVEQPRLIVKQMDPNTVRLQWPSVATGFVLQASADMNPTNWVNVPSPPSDDGTNKFLVISIGPDRQFWRLVK